MITITHNNGKKENFDVWDIDLRAKIFTGEKPRKVEIPLEELKDYTFSSRMIKGNWF